MTNYELLKHLVQLVNGKTRLHEFLEKIYPLGEEIRGETLNELPAKCRKHEELHAKEWEKYDINSWHTHTEDECGTYPDKESLLAFINQNNIDEKKFIAIFLDVVSAPEKEGMNLGFTDKWQKRVLSGEFKNTSDLAEAYATS